MPTIGMTDPNKGMEPAHPYAFDVILSQVPQVSAYTFTGPTSGLNGAASTNFTVALPATVIAPFPITITPADSGTGTAGVFTPTSVLLTNDSRSATFTYTPGSTGVKVISTTNSIPNPATVSPFPISNPASINYTSS